MGKSAKKAWDEDVRHLTQSGFPSLHFWWVIVDKDLRPVCKVRAERLCHIVKHAVAGKLNPCYICSFHNRQDAMYFVNEKGALIKKLGMSGTKARF